MANRSNPDVPHQGSGQAPPQGGYQQPPPGYYYGPPPKKKHTVRNVLLGLTAVFVLMIGGCVALLGGAANEIDKAIDEEAANDKPTDVRVGKKFTHDDYDVSAGWKVSREFGSITIKNMSVTNTQSESVAGGSGRTALLTFRFYNGKENLAEVECNSKEMQEGESSAMDCFSTDNYPKKRWNSVRVADFW